MYDDGSPVDMGKFWRDGEPNDAGSSEDCMALYQGQYLLNDMECTTSCRVLCEIP